MKTHLLRFTALLLVLAGVAASCNPEEYPKEISFTKYSLTGASCQWQNLPYNEKVIVINSSTELNKYISCTAGSYSAIDFTKHSLLLISGYVNGSVSKIIVKDLKQVSSTKCILSIALDLSYKDNTEPWRMALIVAKLSDESSVNLNLTRKVPKVIHPVEITNSKILNFFNFVLAPEHSSFCYFPDICKDSCILINSMLEFRQSYTAGIPPLPEIDFDNFTLILGKKSFTYSFTMFTDQKIIEDHVLTLLVQKYDYPWGDSIYSERYHWGIYPKLPNKPLDVEYEYGF